MRGVKKYFSGIKSVDGAGVHLQRCFGYNDINDFDPFLLLDFFNSKNPNDYMRGFPWHPHRGIETITYMMDGAMEHEDSLGNKGLIDKGDCQWMSAGSGILHQEMPKESNHMFGTQLWLNLDKEDKMNSPKYREIKKEDIVEYRDSNMKINVIAGEYKGVKGPIQLDKTEPIYFDIKLKSNSEVNMEIKENLNVFSLVVEGEINFSNQDNKYIGVGSGVLFDMKGNKIKLKTKKEPARILLIGGKPLNQEIAWGGPIVMNTKEELDLAFKELDNNTFIK